MPKENNDLIELFKRCKTHTKFVVFRIMMDGFPREIKEIVREVNESDIFFFRTAVWGALKSLEKDGLVLYQEKTKRWVGAGSVYLMHNLTDDSYAVLRLLSDSPRAKDSLREHLGFEEVVFDDLVKDLIVLNLVELLDRDGSEANVLRLV